MDLLSDFFAPFFNQLPLAICWAIYAAFHSLTASNASKEFIKRRWQILFASYRLIYNVLAVLLLIPIVALSLKTPGPLVWSWHGPSAWIMNGFAAIALLSFLRGGGGYDLAAFLGLRPESRSGPAKLVISNWHRFVRHPWYSLGLVLIWTRDMSAASLMSATAITLYFVIGSRLEEGKLVAEFGDRYREYQSRVPALIPRPWRVLSKVDAQRIAG